jgi:hypothetical protein
MEREDSGWHRLRLRVEPEKPERRAHELARGDIIRQPREEIKAALFELREVRLQS